MPKTKDNVVLITEELVGTLVCTSFIVIKLGIYPDAIGLGIMGLINVGIVLLLLFEVFNFVRLVCQRLICKSKEQKVVSADQTISNVTKTNPTEISYSHDSISRRFGEELKEYKVNETASNQSEF